MLAPIITNGATNKFPFRGRGEEMKDRKGKCKTEETDVELELNVDGKGKYNSNLRIAVDKIKPVSIDDFELGYELGRKHQEEIDLKVLEICQRQYEEQMKKK